MLTCPGKGSWHCHQSGVFKTRRLNIYCRDARFFRQQEQNNVWPTAVRLLIKLYGSKEELEKTATFILQTGLSV